MICQYYYPEPFRISDICEELVKRGHSVKVVTGIPNYPMGKIYSEYRKRQKRDEIINGVIVHRCFTIGRRSGAIFRFLNYYSYAISSEMYVSGLKDEYDVVFVNQLSPVMMALAGIRYKKMYGKKLILYCLDLWPESVVTGGIKKESALYKYFLKVSSEIYQQADKILISSKMFRDYFFDMFGISGEFVEHLPQYAESVFSNKSCKQHKNNIIDFVFAGNIGKAQSVETIIEAARILYAPNMEKQIRFHIIGDGSHLSRCKRLAECLENVVFYGRKPYEELSDFYDMADAFLVTLSADEDISRTLPGKVQSYMAAGKPIIAAASGETRYVIEDAQCGFCCEPENPAALADTILMFVNCEIYEKLSSNASKYYQENYGKAGFMMQLENNLIGAWA